MTIYTCLSPLAFVFVLAETISARVAAQNIRVFILAGKIKMGGTRINCVMNRKV